MSKTFPAYNPSPNKNKLASIHGQKCLCGKFGIEVGYCETIGKSSTEESHFEKLGLHHDPGDRNGNSSICLGTQL